MTKYIIYTKYHTADDNSYYMYNEPISSMEEVIETIKNIDIDNVYKVVKIEELDVVETGRGGYDYGSNNEEDSSDNSKTYGDDDGE